MKKWSVLLVLVALLLVGYLVAGPFLAINAIGDAIASQNTAALSRHIDFPALRGNLKIQIEDYLVRRAGPDVQSDTLGAVALRIAGGMAGGAVDAAVTPAGIGAILEGRGLLHRIRGDGIRDDDPYAHEPAGDPLQDAEHAFESPSRFTATVHDEDGRPVVVVLTRDGLRWRVTNIRLPLEQRGSG